MVLQRGASLAQVQKPIPVNLTNFTLGGGIGTKSTGGVQTQLSGGVRSTLGGGVKPHCLGVFAPNRAGDSKRGGFRGQPHEYLGKIFRGRSRDR